MPTGLRWLRSGKLDSHLNTSQWALAGQPASGSPQGKMSGSERGKTENFYAFLETHTPHDLIRALSGTASEQVRRWLFRRWSWLSCWNHLPSKQIKI